MEYLTAGSLRKLLAALADDVIIGVDCESGGEPHPLMEMYGLNVEAALLTEGRVNDPHPPVSAVMTVFLASDERSDLSTPDTWAEANDEDDEDDERGHRRNTPFCAKCGGDCAYDSDGNLI